MSDHEVCGREIAQLMEEVREKDVEIERLVDGVCKENTELKTMVSGLANAADAYLAVDGSSRVFNAAELSQARLNLRSVVQHAREGIER